MGSTTQPTDFSDLYTSLENRVSAQTGVTATETQAKRYINTALIDMHVGFSEGFSWAERRSQIVTQPQYTDGTLSVSVGGTTLTGSGTLWNTNNDYGVPNMRVGGKIVIAGASEVYEITAVASDTSATIGNVYVPTTAASGDSYVYFEDEYALASDFLRPIDQRRFSQGATPIGLISRTEFRMRFPDNRSPATPSIATLIDIGFSGDTSRRRRIRFHPPPSTAMVIPYSYITSNLAVSSSGTEQVSLSADADEPIVPLQYRHAIVLHALYNWYRDKRDDSRSQEAKAEYVDLMLRIVGDHEIGSPRPRLAARVGPYRSRAKRPWRGGSGRYDTNGWFDRLEDIR